MAEPRLAHSVFALAQAVQHLPDAALGLADHGYSWQGVADLISTRTAEVRRLLASH
jgi:hypothetical protein